MRNTYKTSILLDEYNKVEDFVKMSNKMSCDVDISQDYKRTVDGKSIMGILLLDLSKTVNVILLNPTEKDKTLLEGFVT